MQRNVGWILFLVAFSGVSYLVYTNQERVREIAQSVGIGVVPCAEPITYSIDTIDPRFGISTQALINNLREAEAIWEEPSGRNLFQYSENEGAVAISLVYDSRQAATDSLEAAGIALDKSKSSYDTLKAMYDTLSAKVEGEQATYLKQVAEYKRAEDAYNAEVERWNKRGGAPKEEYEQLQAKKEELFQAFTEVKAFEEAIQAHIDTLGALATTLNQLIVQLNLNVAQYNRAGASAGEFEEGLYERSGGVETITVYEYANHTQLVRVLAHELGHALSLEHIADEGAIMYKINQGKGLEATPADIAELARVCSAGT